MTLTLSHDHINGHINGHMTRILTHSRSSCPMAILAQMIAPRTRPVEPRARPLCMSLSKNAKILLVGTNTGKVYVYNPEFVLCSLCFYPLY